MATSAAYFSGSAIMPSQSAASAASAPSPAKVHHTLKPISVSLLRRTLTPSAPPPQSRDPRFSGCVPTTVLHIARSLAAAAATDGGGDPVVAIDGVEVTNARVLGRVVSVVNRETDVSFTLDDGTGKIPLVRWLTDQTDAHEAAFVQYEWSLPQGSSYPCRVSSQAAGIRSLYQQPVTNFNEVVLHFIECMHVHLENVRPKMQGHPPQAVQTNASTHVIQGHPPQAFQTNASTHVMQGQLPHAVQTSAPAYEPFSGGMREHQVHFSQVKHGRFPLPAQMSASSHALFSGGVREQQIHYTPQPNQFSVYPVTGAQQHDLQRMVLEVMQQPDLLALENGVHVDEVARRLGMPTSQILATAQNLVNMACVYSTIDDYHFKSAING
ncbi:hypothetical protein ACP70R_043942 [Stipagrostis hirtigluma subsp. patula]